ncbi:unnamed protein product [Symbiodinium natans]|uniref:Uncharacterized protein n=1 Tax=Symbiodinium natans TaxID=878477 RepID=A0A812TCJ2_9DINO|nr:unnamed protein product [Symbiodinium natans]
MPWMEAVSFQKLAELPSKFGWLLEAPLEHQASRGTKHRARLRYFAYSPVSLAAKLYVIVYWLEEMTMVNHAQILWVWLLFVQPLALILAVVYRDKISEYVVYLLESPAASNNLMKLQAYGVVALYLIPVLCMGSAQAIAETLPLSVLGYFSVYLPLMDDANTVSATFGMHFIVAVACSCGGAVDLTNSAIAFAVCCSVTEGVVFRLLLSRFDTGLREDEICQCAPKKRLPLEIQKLLEESGNSRMLLGDSLRAFAFHADLIHREGRGALKHLLLSQRKRVDRREEGLGQLIALIYLRETCGLDRNSLLHIFQFLQDWQPLQHPAGAAGLLGPCSVISSGTYAHNASGSGSMTTIERIQNATRRLLQSF